MKRLLLYVHYNKYDELSGHVLYQLEQLRPLFSKLIVISNSQLTESATLTLKELGIDEVIQRENLGFDFAAWRDGMAHVGFEHLTDFDSVTLMNDTCFGPLWDITDIVEEFEKRPNVDFWGMTNFRKTKYFDEHLQSYFMFFKKHVVASEAFQKFWTSIKTFTDVQDVIDNYETRVTSVLLEAGYRYDAVFNTIAEEAGDLIHPDFSYYRPISTLEHKVPFIKLKAFTDNEKKGRLLLDYLANLSTYPVALIKSHLNSYHSPDSLVILDEKIIDPSFKTLSKHEYRMVIHVHISDLERLKVFFDSKLSAFYFFTLSSRLDKNEVENTLLNSFDKDRFQIVSQRFDNHYHALVSLASQLCDYDFVGHFHTEAFGNEGKLVDEATRHALVDMLSDDEKVVSIFDHFPEVGLVFADLSKELYWTDAIGALNQEQTVKLTNECQKVINHSLHIFQGSMWLSKDFLEKIILKDKQAFYGFDEDTLPYLFYRKAWDLGIDYRIIASEKLSFAERYKVHLIEMSQVAEPVTLKDKFSAYRKALLKKLGLKKSSAV
ncbi:rhamnan synthesis F family protein [Streptococcus vestibularis]|uniref:rhamnan synthesis F family protein n=1 Tax=Streptococcus vestibularis TaxID=1343 RepID=UPI0023305504|nr:rhamnan synthesis F family protein [Streptococcus vestibularis]MDB6184859.1 rhamnan synthesis F family protein [Streptococcus vestibularis]MDB6202146.1 rhamnan synthesis F family protein [Streptococcus vestibularis]MDB6208271.1 rhamnan synthesis F family protein [Streptococcus vestibularis]MDB6211678.1 rhamnan synthesis F family protein [Streptococcus vestibularis]MDB6216003.1 rhamnan synthesis F family protein [Streptococcus vestibularis]